MANNQRSNPAARERGKTKVVESLAALLAGFTTAINPFVLCTPAVGQSHKENPSVLKLEQQLGGGRGLKLHAFIQEAFGIKTALGIAVSRNRRRMLVTPNYPADGCRSFKDFSFQIALTLPSVDLGDEIVNALEIAGAPLENLACGGKFISFPGRRRPLK